MQIPVGSKHEKGFELISGMRIDRKAAKVLGSLQSEEAYMLNHAVDITESTRWVTLRLARIDPQRLCYITVARSPLVLTVFLQ